MELKEAFLWAVQDVLNMFGMQHKFDKEAEEALIF